MAVRKVRLHRDPMKFRILIFMYQNKCDVEIGKQPLLIAQICERYDKYVAHLRFLLGTQFDHRKEEDASSCLLNL